jgi:hypothetical protein
MLGMHYGTLRRHLEDSDAVGFQVLERRSPTGRRLRYLAVDEIRQAMGQVPLSNAPVRTAKGGMDSANGHTADTPEEVDRR